MWDVSGTELAVLPHPDVVPAAVFSPRGEKILTSCMDGFLRLWTAVEKDLLEIAARRVTREFSGPELERLGRLLKHAPEGGGEESRGFLREAETLVEGK